MENGSDENGKWVTVNGTHIFIKDGETVEQVLKRKQSQVKDWENEIKYTPKGLPRSEGNFIANRYKLFNLMREVDQFKVYNSVEEQLKELRERQKLFEEYNLTYQEREDTDDLIKALENGYGQYGLEAYRKDRDNERAERAAERNKEWAETKLFNTTNGEFYKKIDELGLKEVQDLTMNGRGSVWDNDNVYTKKGKDDIKDAINDVFDKDFLSLVDFSRKSEATYIDIRNKDNEGDDSLKIRIGSHFKDGTSGDADLYLDYRAYKNLPALRYDLGLIASVLKGKPTRNKNKVF